MASSKITSGDSLAGAAIASGDDGSLVIQTGPAGSKVNAIALAADGTATLAKVPVNTTAQSMVRLNTANGYGSTNTVIRRFTNVVTNQGTDITYADSATLGATFTINTSGVYSVSYNDQFNPAEFMGLSLNSSQLTTSILGITPSDILAVTQNVSANNPGFVGWCGYLAAGSIVRAHNRATSVTGATPTTCQFTITRVA